MKGILEILASASEYGKLVVRPREEEKLRRLLNHQRFSIENTRFNDPQVKVNVLLQAHFLRRTVGGILAHDQRDVLLSAGRLVRSMVDVISSNGWLSLALLAMEVSQMVTQGMWERDSVLMQLLHFTRELAEKCREKKIETVFDLVGMEDDERCELLQMSDAELLDVAKLCNQYPNIDVAYEVVGAENEVAMEVVLERDTEARTEMLRCSKEKEEGWWVVVGDSETNQLVAIKRVSLVRKVKVKLEFAAPAGQRRRYTLYLMCDSYMGCDQEYGFTIDVGAASEKISKNSIVVA